MRYTLTTIQEAITASIQNDRTVKVYVDSSEKGAAKAAIRERCNTGMSQDMTQDGEVYRGRTTGADDFSIELVVSGWVDSETAGVKVELDDGVPVKISVIAGEFDEFPDVARILSREFYATDVSCRVWEAGEAENEQVALIHTVD